MKTALLLFLGFFFSFGIMVGHVQRGGMPGTPESLQRVADYFSLFGICQDWHFFTVIGEDDQRFLVRLDFKDRSETHDLRADFTQRYSLTSSLGAGRISRYFDALDFDFTPVSPQSNRAYHYFGLSSRYCQTVPNLEKVTLIMGSRKIPHVGKYSRAELLSKASELDDFRPIYTLGCHELD